MICIVCLRWSGAQRALKAGGAGQPGHRPRPSLREVEPRSGEPLQGAGHRPPRSGRLVCLARSTKDQWQWRKCWRRWRETPDEGGQLLELVATRGQMPILHTIWRAGRERGRTEAIGKPRCLPRLVLRRATRAAESTRDAMAGLPRRIIKACLAPSPSDRPPLWGRAACPLFFWLAFGWGAGCLICF